MQTLTEMVLRAATPGGFFDETAVRNLLSDRSEGARKALVHRALARREVVRLKPGLFLLAPEFRKSHLHPFVIAALLHSPSHVSVESALAYHGLIPEAVYQVASVTAARGRTFETPVGVFVYQRVPAVDPRAGVRAHTIDGRNWVFIASPLRAIADLIRLRKAVSWERDGTAFLTDSMRIEPHDLDKVRFDDLEAICRSLRDRRTVDYLRGLHREMAS